MAQISIGGAVESGFKLIRHRPLAILSWGLVQALLLAATFALFAPFYALMLQAGASGQNPAEAMQAMNGQILQTQALSYLVDLIEVVAGAIVNCAVWRAVIHPDQGRFGYLRLGAPEFFFGVLIIGAYIAFFVAFIAVGVVVGIVIGVLIFSHAVAVAVILGIVAVIAALVGIVYVALRFSLVGPMMVDDGQFHLGESWALTRGHVGALFVISLVVFVILMAIELVFVIVLFAIGLGAVSALAGGLQNIPVWARQPGELGHLAPLLAVFAALWIPLGGVVFAILGAPWARAYLDLKPKDLAAAFT
jgi:hypothetical protein